MHQAPRPDKPPFITEDGREVAPPTGNRRQILLDPMVEPWEHQPHESQHNFGLFKLFMELGPTRNLRTLEELSGRKLTHLRNLQYNNQWRERCAAWDKYNQDIFVQRMAAARQEAAQAHIRAADSLLKTALRRLETLQPKEISPTVLVMMFAEAAKIHRLALGMEDTPITTVNVQAGARSSSGGGRDDEVIARVEVTTMQRSIMDDLADMFGRMSQEQIIAGKQELLALESATAPASTSPLDDRS